MPTEVVMPQMGESIFEGTITKWLKKAGERVEKDEPLFEISTDKVDAEIPSPVAGVLQEIKVPEGKTVEVNSLVAIISDEGSHVSAPEVAPPAPLAAPQVPQVVVMPQMGESITEGTITKWLKAVGERVEKDEPLFEISTDKVDAEIPSPAAGTLTEIRVAQGATVEINTVVAIIGGTVGAPVAAPASAMPAVAVSAPVAAVAPVLAAAPVAVSVDPNRELRTSPLVRRIAKENNLDLHQVPGTGLQGRISKEDVLQHLTQHSAGSTSQQSPVTLLPPSAASAAPQVLPLSKMRAIIAQRMVESLVISPHVHSVFKIDMTKIVRQREREKKRFELQNGVKLTYMPYIAAATVEALRKFPIVNSSLINGSIHYHRNINLGIAVALEWGLIVPVVKQAEERSFLSLAKSINDLAARARAKKLMPDEVQGSTFTLTNSGILGEEFGTPIINQPDSAILAIGGLRKEPVVLTDAEGNDTIGIRSVQYFCLGFDHRTIDGADAGKFMSELKRVLENWDRTIS